MSLWPLATLKPTPRDSPEAGICTVRLFLGTKWEAIIDR
jgi:hypothetical protein